MKTFPCHCGNTLYFENSRCLACGRGLGFLPDALILSAFEPVEGGESPDGLPAPVRPLAPQAGGRLYRPCRNYDEFEVCNWLLLEEDPNPFCPSCRLNRVIPNLSTPGNRVLWSRIETAKRRLLYTLFSLRLPVVGQDRDPHAGLAFAFLADPGPGGEFTDPMGRTRTVLTGHQKGLITINLAEADDPERERMRERMNELYRTLLGHFRHESGHYYWERLVANDPVALEAFRTRFGDERTDYDQALKRHYDAGERSGWRATHVSAYAAAHPWEDWAETWAHYLHMVDTLETAQDFGLRLGERYVSAPNGGGAPFAALLSDWEHLTAIMNALNRSMGLPDPYPFILSGPAADKLAFVHGLVTGRTAPAAASG
jgi:hypothetical protein